MKTFLTLLVSAVLTIAAQATTHTLAVHGVIDTVSATNPLMKVGDDVMFIVHYDPSGGNSIGRTTVFVNESALQLSRTSPGGHVTIDENPADGTVQWRVGDASAFSFDVATNTPGGTIPCIDSFDLGRVFSIFFNNIIVNGTVTAKPHDRVGF